MPMENIYMQHHAQTMDMAKFHSICSIRNCKIDNATSLQILELLWWHIVKTFKGKEGELTP
jgi:hypothetical protein